jgi:hypothetical protein
MDRQFLEIFFKLIDMLVRLHNLELLLLLAVQRGDIQKRQA